MALVGVRKGTWTEEEDLLLKKCIDKYGEGRWNLVPSRAGLNRCRKSCRLRWLNYLHPDIKRGNFGFDEVDLIVRLHKLLGNRWSLIAGRLPGRTPNKVKNFWNTHMHKIEKTIGTANDMSNNDSKNSKAFKIIKPRPRTFSKKLILGGKSTRSNDISIKKNPDKTSSLLEIDDNIMQCWETMFANNSKENDVCGEPNLSLLSCSEEDHVTSGPLLWSDEILPGVEEKNNNLVQVKQNGTGSLDDICIDMNFGDLLNSNW